jgi:hypothetical protein
MVTYKSFVVVKSNIFWDVTWCSPIEVHPYGVTFEMIIIVRY